MLGNCLWGLPGPFTLHHANLVREARTLKSHCVALRRPLGQSGVCQLSLRKSSPRGREGGWEVAPSATSLDGNVHTTDLPPSPQDLQFGDRNVSLWETQTLRT